MFGVSAVYRVDHAIGELTFGTGVNIPLSLPGVGLL
jgi:hypothetical protein